MKRILLIVLLLFTTGCYDYVELNNLSIISSIGIDYQDNEFILTYEVLKDDKSSNIISIKGNSIPDCFNNVSTILNKIPYYYHLKVVIISEEIAKNHLKEITDYFIRNPKIIHSFYLIMCKDITAKEFLSINKDTIIGNEIVSKIENNSYEYSILYNELFEDVLERLLNKRKDALLGTFIISDNNIESYGIALFKDNKLSKILDKEQSAYLNILLNNNANITLENNELIIGLYNTSSSIDFDNNNVIININADAQIIENKEVNNLKKDESYTKFNNEFSELLKSKISNLLDEIETDPLCIKWRAYQKYKKDIDLDNYIINVDLKVNKKGLIFEANYEE